MRLDTFIKELQKLMEKHGNLNLVYEDDYTPDDDSFSYYHINNKPRFKAKCNYIKQKKDRLVNVTEPVIVLR